ncbi:MAG TPA: hypothetical protein VEK84_02025 [Terriglobales bacterium]|nr:hypothetical protein [Terriglobales bacterium]
MNNSTAVSSALPNIEELLAYCDITIGILRPVGCVAFQMLR